MSLTRHLYDTRLFARMYAVFAMEVVDREKKYGASKTIARTELGQELAHFFEEDLPEGQTVFLR